MISKLSELQEHTRWIAGKVPELREEILLNSPGCTGAECARLKEVLHNLPDGYIECLQKFDLRRFGLCYFSLRPSFGKNGIVESLILANISETNPMLPFLRSHGLYEVAAWEADPVCVATGDSSYPEGAVLWVTPPEPVYQIMPLADDFEKFLLIAGNLDAVRDRYSKAVDRRASAQEFMGVLRYLRVSEEASISWKKIADVVLPG